MSGPQSAIRIISGKGGVGKTSVATALALAHVQTGKRVLLAEMHGHDRVAALLGVEPVGATLREVFDDLTVVDMNPADAIREYVLLTLRFELLYRAVFENRMVRHFLRLVPSLNELVMLGKIWYHAQEVVHGKPRFDLVVVDAPATGHAMALLRAPAAVRGAVPPGPMRDNARLLHDMLVNAEQTRLHVVTTPEEMPVTEAAELLQAARTAGVAVGAPVINQRLQPLPAGGLAALAPLAQDALLAAVPAAMQEREARRLAGEGELRHLGDALLATSISLPRLVRPRFDIEALRLLADIMTPACAAGVL